MLELLAIVGLVLALAATYLLARAAYQPNTFSWARSIVVAAPPERVFP
jgi:Co/Zn/Cd efflux system component